MPVSKTELAAGMRRIQEVLEQTSTNELFFHEPANEARAALLLVQMEVLSELVRRLVGPEAAATAHDRAMKAPMLAPGWQG